MNRCLLCHRIFKSKKALTSHYQQQSDCYNHFLNIEVQLNSLPNSPAKTMDYKLDNIEINNNNSSDDENTSIDSLIENYNFHESTIDKALKDRYNKHLKSGNDIIIESNSLMQSQIDLLILLNQAKAPLYLFDEIWKWTQQSAEIHKVNFENLSNINRAKCIRDLKKTFDLNGLDPIKKLITLKGSNTQIELVLHNFENALYSLLSDNLLMDPLNLLFTTDFANQQKSKNKNSIINDIDTGSVYQHAIAKYINTNNREILCPIIFFIDKTHTDVQGRLCLEQIRFTLGIFNRETRNNPNAWRTLGYIADQAYIKTTNSFEKNQDYHHMMSEILAEFKEFQKKFIEWDLSQSNSDDPLTVYFKLLVLFIIGDTDGHDKIAGRYTSRNGIQQPCRCCNVSFDETDNPEYKFTYNKHKLSRITNGTISNEELKALSIHGIDNAWKDILFCDNDRGLYGILCGDILHCLQHGLFNYALQALFDSKAAKRSTTITDENDNEDEPVEFSSKNVFSQNYSKHFDDLAKQYGLYLSHQSDRDLPRTHINTNYTTITRKNANEMAGILITILIVLTTDEGTNNLDKIMAGLQTAKFIQLFEILLLLENFCASPEHKIMIINKFKKFVPYILNTYKDILDRQTGCGCKFIKFHLPNHFADDMLRFGSMLNFDTGIGESHHKTEAKSPSKNTQRRKSEFEYQTATRQIENLSINKASAYFENKAKHNDFENNENTTETSNKWYRYEYDPDNGLRQKLEKDKYKDCNWKDKCFQQQLLLICQNVYKNQNINGKLKFFSLHTRQSCLFRGDPNYKNDECWYDWVEVNWSNELLPTKILLFWDIEPNSIKKPFKIGDISITVPGQYAFCYSLKSETDILPAHTQSLLVQYGKLDTDKEGTPNLYIFHVDCIASTLSAVPYKVKDNLYNATEWLFLRPKLEWYKIFVDHMTEELDKEKQNASEEYSKKKPRTF